MNLKHYPIITLLLNVLLPLLLGSVIYYFTRSHSIYFLAWLCPGPHTPLTTSLHVPNWVVYNLPDGLWMFAFSSLLLTIWQQQVTRQNLPWLLSPVIIAILLEITTGTFDVLDVLFIIAGSLLSFLLLTKNKNLTT